MVYINRKKECRTNCVMYKKLRQIQNRLFVVGCFKKFIKFTAHVRVWGLNKKPSTSLTLHEVILISTSWDTKGRWGTSDEHKTKEEGGKSKIINYNPKPGAWRPATPLQNSGGVCAPGLDRRGGLRAAGVQSGISL